VKILGIDPGSRTTGYGIIGCQNDRVSYIESGVIRSSRKSYPASLTEMFLEIEKIIGRYKPDAVAIEEIFFASNAQSALKLGHARGVILLAVFRSGSPLYEYSALEVKKAVTGYGRAEKTQVQKMIMKLLNIKSAPTTDASDALAVAICHAHSMSRHKLTEKNV